jgi:sugar O-acyltransferase (sialic acid O-acetyltransferase NeuD family)
MKRIVILGTGGNCRDILDTLLDLNAAKASEEYRCLGFLDDDPAKHGSELLGHPVLGPIDLGSTLSESWFINGIGSPASFLSRRGIVEKVSLGVAKRWETLLHPTASVSRFSTVGAGSVLFQHVTVNSRSSVGKHVLILANSVISHDAVIGDHTCVAGGACIAGAVTIGPSCYIGAGAKIIGNVTIGERSLIGMGSVVLHDVAPGSVMVGNPARRLRSVAAAAPRV